MPQSQRPQRSADLNFITFGEPQQTKATRAIRSHAARAGWKSRKNSKGAPSPLVHATSENAPAVFMSTHQGDLSGIPSWSNDTTPHHATTHSLSSSSSRSSLSAKSSSSTPLTAQSPRDVNGVNSKNDVDFSKPQVADEDQENRLPSHFSNDDLSRADLSSSTRNVRLQPIGSAHNSFSQFPVHWENSFDSLVDFYRNCLGEVWLNLIQADWGRQGNIDFVDFPLHISVAQGEPAIFYAVISNASVMAPPSNAMSMRQQPFLSQYLRHKAVEALRDAIADPKRSCTDAVICTVDFVYLNEALRGEHEVSMKVHGPALLKMVAARGGLNAIASKGKEGLILSRMILWTDRIVASTINVPQLFPNYVEDPSLGQTEWTGIWSKVQTMM